MSALSFALALAFALAGAPSPAEARAAQWLFRETNSGPAAIFLDWDYRSVIFRIGCDKPRRELEIEYFAHAGSGLIPEALREPMAINLGDHAYPIQREPAEPERIGGTLRLTRGFMQKLRAYEGEIEIEAPNEMGEPWYVGSAAPLRRLAQLCAGT